MKHTVIALGIVLALSPMAAQAAPTHAPKPKAPAPAQPPATQAALAWLALVDKGAYDKSYTEAAPAFQAQVTQDQWIQAMQQVRAPLGAVKIRTFASIKNTKTLPGAPNGDYAVIQYSTDFAGKASVETIVMVKGTDGKWRTDGYFIK